MADASPHAYEPPMSDALPGLRTPPRDQKGRFTPMPKGLPMPHQAAMARLRAKKRHGTVMASWPMDGRWYCPVNDMMDCPECASVRNAARARDDLVTEERLWSAHPDWLCLDCGTTYPSEVKWCAICRAREVEAAVREGIRRTFGSDHVRAYAPFSERSITISAPYTISWTLMNIRAAWREAHP